MPLWKLRSSSPMANVLSASAPQDIEQAGLRQPLTEPCVPAGHTALPDASHRGQLEIAVYQSAKSYRRQPLVRKNRVEHLAFGAPPSVWGEAHQLLPFPSLT